MGRGGGKKKKQRKKQIQHTSFHSCTTVYIYIAHYRERKKFSILHFIPALVYIHCPLQRKEAISSQRKKAIQHSPVHFCTSVYIILFRERKNAYTLPFTEKERNSAYSTSSLYCCIHCPLQRKKAIQHSPLNSCTSVYIKVLYRDRKKEIQHSPLHSCTNVYIFLSRHSTISTKQRQVRSFSVFYCFFPVISCGCFFHICHSRHFHQTCTACSFSPTIIMDCTCWFVGFLL